MKWPWNCFGFVERPDPHQPITAAFKEIVPEATLRSVARDVDSVKVAVDVLSAPPDAMTVDRIRLQLGVTSLQVIFWSDDREVLVARALQPAAVERVVLFRLLGRAIAMVQENQMHLAKGDHDQNVRLANKLCGWDIEVMTAEQFGAGIERALNDFRELTGVTDALAHRLVEEGCLSFDDLTIIDPDSLREMGNLSEAEAYAILTQAESKSAETYGLDR
jgi:transcription termination/antitermination protein NusA